MTISDSELIKSIDNSNWNITEMENNINKLNVLIVNNDNLYNYRAIYKNNNIKFVRKYFDFIKELFSKKWDIIHIDGDFESALDCDTYLNESNYITPYSIMDGLHKIHYVNEEDLPQQIIVSDFCSKANNLINLIKNKFNSIKTYLVNDSVDDNIINNDDVI